ncbi:hypothetical protein CIK66_18465 [Brachybacterium alimentarium]|uniref:ABC transporter substrate-binding protein n=2 Tax=Brachybacterium alimentarium TaxID=47845 RepID=A0A2A3YEB1_9MICO|nr:hypothetical protein CIK66_18465 [Brachybacterium alimentarium]
MATSGTTALLGVAACSSGETNGDDSGAGSGPATGEIEFWAWAAGLDTIVDEFNASQSDITVNYNVIPSGADAYKKIESAVKSGSGPDLAQVEAQQIPTFAVSGGVLMDVATGAEQYKQNYSPATWNSAGFQGQQYGIPNDQGPLVAYVNDDLLTAAGAEFADTWEEYRDLADKVRTDTDAYLGTLVTAGAFMAAVSWQNNAHWFAIEDDSWVVSLNGEATREALNFWIGMANDDLVTVNPGGNAGFWQTLDASEVVSYTTGIWGYRGMKGNLERTSGAWRAMPVPQWEGIEPMNSLWGGSNWAVMEGSKNAAAALKFADWLAAEPTAMNLQYENSGYYPASDAEQVDGYAESDEFFGGQKVASVFAEAADLVGDDWQWGPSMTTVYTLLEDSIGDAIKTGDCTEMLNSVQEEVVGRLRDSGLEVREG